MPLTPLVTLAHVEQHRAGLIDHLRASSISICLIAERASSSMFFEDLAIRIYPSANGFAGLDLQL